MQEQSMNVLLSIKPEFAEKILAGEKGYEFRKTSFRDPGSVDIIYMYASSPVQKIVGSFALNEVIEDSPETLWRLYGSESGIKQRTRFLNYFSQTETGYAFEIDQPQRLSTPKDPQQCFEDFHPPMSFRYVDDDFQVRLDGNRIATGGD